MTFTQGIRLASRTIALYLVLLAVGDVLDLLGTIPSLIRISQITSSISHPPYNAPPAQTVYATPPLNLARSFIPIELTALLGVTLKIVTWLCAARWFYLCGPGLQRFFTAPDTPTTD